MVHVERLISSYSYDRSWDNCKFSTSNFGKNQWPTKSNCIISNQAVDNEKQGNNVSTWLIFPTWFVHLKKQWRMQLLTSAFCSRWRKELVSTLQPRLKWTTKERNFKINDIDLIQTDAKRNSCPMKRILEINKVENNVFGSLKSWSGQ